MAPHRMRVSRGGGLLDLVLDSPERGNTIDRHFTAAFVEALEDLDDVACVLITAQGRNFCLGGDLAAVSTSADAGSYIDDLAREFHAGLRRLQVADVPVIAGAQGWSAGAGLSLLLTADVLILEDDAQLRTAYTAVGFTPDGGMSWTLPRAVGRARAMDMLLSNRPMAAREALAAGLASRVVPTGTGADAARKLALDITRGPRQALARTLDLVRTGRDRSYIDHLDAERRSIAIQAGGIEGHQGIAAFLERRPPAWAATTAVRPT